MFSNKKRIRKKRTSIHFHSSKFSFRLMASTCLIFLIGLFPKEILAQKNCQFQIKGYVIDSTSNERLGFCNIEIENNKKTVFTNSDGEFLIKNVCPGIIDIHVSHLQCEHLHLEFNLYKDTFIIIYIQHKDVIINGFKLTHKNEINNQQSLNNKQIDNLKGLSISEMFGQINGVDLLRTGSNISKPMVSGLHSNRVIIINNEIRQEGQNWGLEHAPEIDGNIAQEMVLIKGSEALRFAQDGIGGVLLMKPMSIFSERAKTIKTHLSQSMMSNGKAYQSSFSLGYKISEQLPLSFRIYGTIGESGNLRAPNYYIANTGKKEMNYAAMMGFNKTRNKIDLFYSHFNNEIGIFQGAHIGNLTDLNAAIKSDRPLVNSGFTYQINRPNQLVEHDLIKLKNDYIINSKNNIELIVSYQRNQRSEYDILRSNNSFTGPGFNYFIKTLITDLLWSKKDFHKLNFKAGIFGINQSNSFSGRYVVPGFIMKGGAAYFISHLDKGKWDFESAIRYDYKTMEVYLWNQNIMTVKNHEFNHLTYHLQANYKKSKAHHFNFTTASAWRPPSINELYINGLHQSLASIEIGDDQLKPERSFNNSIQYFLNHRFIQLETEVFYKYIHQFINIVPTATPVLTIRGAFPAFVYEQYDVQMIGLNYLLKYKIHENFFINQSSNWVIGDQFKTKKPLNQMPPLSSKISFNFKKKNLSVLFELMAVARQFRYVEGSDLLEPPDAFVLLNSQIQYQFKIKNQKINVSLDLKNMANQSYREYLNRLRYFTDEIGFNAILRLHTTIN